MPIRPLADLPPFFLCRHGQTDWNAEERMQGQRDIELNETGRRQAVRNGRKLRELLGETASAFRYVSSPLCRSTETMSLIRRELGLSPDDFQIDERLKEIHFGDWEGSTLQELSLADHAAVEAREADKWNYVPPGVAAESYEALSVRVAPVFDALDAPSILVAHGGIIRVFLKLYDSMASARAAHSAIPQDRILKVSGGRAEWI
ncbi:histidine phosphatase family protein [Consotaella salsifontis]|uniref:Probable phosphoglycerate mutase n=1 Tax=Consotaella salsifontis TaxID=1365950 RepID=A0A1T4MZ73_9HYPH|nr:histidine phosphatase family protein [Consotaella salsifontis]SJZ71938.1 probable phosphoglycerate mutase [Consotaella salsifontis]